MPILAGTGPRDVKVVAGYSADPPAAQKLLVAHGFQTSYVAQYADPATGRVLSVVVTRFATAAGATADLAGDLAASAGTKVTAPTVRGWSIGLRRAARGCSSSSRALESLDGVGNVRGLGMMAAVEVVADKATKQLFPAEIGMAQKLTDALLDRGLCTRVAMDCICVAPPLVTSDAQVDRIVSIIGETVTAVVREALSLKP